MYVGLGVAKVHKRAVKQANDRPARDVLRQAQLQAALGCLHRQAAQQRRAELRESAGRDPHHQAS